MASLLPFIPWRPADAHWDAYNPCCACELQSLSPLWHSLCGICQWFINGLTYNVFGKARIESWKTYVSPMSFTL